MSDVGVSYDATVTPSPVSVGFNLSFSNTTLQARVSSIDLFLIELKPSGGNVLDQFASTFAYPMAAAMGMVLPLTFRGLIEGYTFDVLTVSPSTRTVMDEQVTVQPSRLSISKHDDMMMIHANVDIT